VGGTCAQVALLHTAAWARAGEAVGTLAFRYADGGSSTAAAITVGAEVGDWYRGDALARAATRAMPGACPRQAPVFLSCTAFANPEPLRPVAAVELAIHPEPGKGRPGPRWLVLAATASAGACVPVGRHERALDFTGWIPFAPRPAQAARPLLDCSHLLDAPAGRHGFLRSEGGRFVFADGTPARFFGTSIHAHPALFPSHQRSEEIAATFARLGLNLLRIHLAESMLVERGRADHQGLLPDADWERLDYLMKCCQERGIYLQLCSVTGLSSRSLGEADGVGPGYAKARSWLYWDERLDQLGRRWAARLVSHVNRHTGLAYADDPGIALMLLVNEQTALSDWNGHLGTPEPVRRRLRELFAAWLQQRYARRADLAAAWGDLGADEDPATASVLPAAVHRQRGEGWRDGASPARVRDTLSFLVGIQQRWSAGMAAHLRGLGVRVPLAVTNLNETPPTSMPRAASTGWPTTRTTTIRASATPASWGRCCSTTARWRRARAAAPTARWSRTWPPRRWPGCRCWPPRPAPCTRMNGARADCCRWPPPPATRAGTASCTTPTPAAAGTAGTRSMAARR
jgi:hypothetical protein